MINGANNRMVSKITNRTIKEEAGRSTSTRTFDIVKWIRAHRLQWVGHEHMLRLADPIHMIYKVV